MHIESLHIQHFKSFQDVIIDFNADVNIFTGKNNSGKTTVLEAIALWQECFAKLLNQAKVGREGKKATPYKKGDYILGNTGNKYFPFDEINSIRSPNFSDIFYQKESNKPIQLSAVLVDDDTSLQIGFEIKSSGSNYGITLIGYSSYNFEAFNNFFRKLPSPISVIYTSPVSAIQQIENFTTQPNIQEITLKRESASVLRNRLYAVYRNSDASLYPNFLSSLNYILFDNQAKLDFLIDSDIQKDTRVLINFRIGHNDTPKDIALLGSGSLQVVEILLSLYYRDNRDMSLLLLDEPDSHIHRDIQKRLLKVITDFSSGNQIFLTTHNEALIRESAPRHLFHLENKPKNHYKPLNSEALVQLEKTGGKRSFKGIYPLQTNSIIRSIGSSAGLDFINAIEADRIIFVEGDDDAQAIYTLLQKATIPPTRIKYVFWVLNGISNVFKEIETYKTVFSQIKNEQSLWEKSVLIMDRDFLSDEHYPLIRQKMTEKFLPTYITSAYTLESTILTDLKIASNLLHFWLKDKGIASNKDNIETTLTAEYRACKDVIQSRLDNSSSINNTVHHYQAVRDKTTALFGKNNHPIREDDTALTLHYQEHLRRCFQEETLFKLMNKDDVGRVINAALASYQMTFEIEKDFIDLLKNVAPGRWFSEWDFLKLLVK